MKHEITAKDVPVGRGCGYQGIEFEKGITYPNGHKLVIIAYRAYNAFGLIGPEKNGIAILDVTRGMVLADEIAKSNSYTYNGMTDAQILKAEEIAAFTWDEMVAFVNASGRNRYELTPMKPKGTYRCTHFKAEMFTTTKFHTAKQKARFANHFIKFMKSGYSQDMFPKWFYNELSQCFGHIAHYNQNGFYGTFFTSNEGKQRFLRMTMEHGCYGDPGWTYSDVEKAIQEYLAKK